MIKMRFKKKSWFLCFFILVSIWISHVHPQTHSRGWGRISGIAIDEAGAPIVNANVQVIWQEDPAVIRKTKTNTKGRFRFKDLESGTWELWVKAKGYISTFKSTKIQPLIKIPLIKITLKKPTMALLMELLKGSSSLLEQGHKLYDASRYDEARTFYTKFLQQHPEFYQVHLFVGDCYKNIGENEQAMAEYRQMLDLIAEMAPTEKSRLYTALGYLYLRREKPEAAVIYFDSALEWDPNPQLSYHLGQVFLSLNRGEESIRYFKRAAALKTSWGDPYLKLGYIYLNSGDPKSAAANFRKFLDLSPNAHQAAAIKAFIKKLSKTLD
jgi:Tfp pilus assembly protein PilF/5-hydroxyisourate hydrolase-like protein (transthyretin family)